MSNDSTTGGYVTAPEVPLNDDALDDLFQAMIVGISGLSGTAVRPRFQYEAPVLPKFGTNWAAVGVMGFTTETYGEVHHDATADSGLGRDNLLVWEAIEVLVSFYGPGAQGYALRAKAGLEIAQNWEAINAAGIVYVRSRPPVKAPQLLKERWTNRIDLPLTFRRQVNYSYAIRNLLSASGTINCDGVLTDFSSDGVHQ